MKTLRGVTRIVRYLHMSVPLGLLFLWLLLSAVQPTTARAETSSCEQFSTRSWRQVFKDFKQSERLRMQIYLRLIGYNPQEIDGIIGPHTTAALSRFCRDFLIEPTQNFAVDLVNILSHYAKLASVYPNWKDILLSDDFESWINALPMDQKTEVYKIWRSGTPPLLIPVIKAYLAYEKAGKPVFDQQDFIVSYRLTDADLDHIQSEINRVALNRKFVENLKKIEDKASENEKAFVNTVESIKVDVSSKPDPFVKLSLEKGKAETTYRLTDNSFQRMADNNLIRKIANDILDVTMDVLRMISQESLDEPTKKAIQDLNLSDLADDLMKSLQGLKDKGFDSTTALNAAIQEAIQNVTPEFKLLGLVETFRKLIGTNIPEELLKKIEETFTKLTKEEEEALHPEIAEMFKDIQTTYATRLVKAYAEEVANIKLEEGAAEAVGEALSDDQMPASLVDRVRMSSLLNTEYVYESLFREDLSRAFPELARDATTLDIFTSQAVKKHPFAPLTAIE